MRRYRPVRAGIVNLWDYTDHEFVFHGGRLVLRGANGSGKTKALEVLFPFLLDASISPQRLDPFTGAGRTMRDNLLYRPDRETVTGYAWMEFARGDDDHVVIGAGLRAQRSRPDVTTWYFTTDRPLGAGWSLLDEERQPLTPKALRVLIGADNVYDTATSYRKRVDDVLFGSIGVDRYASMIQLVLYLRRPQLAKDLDLGELSTTLSAGLRPVDDDLLAEGARSFDDLEAVQRELERLEQACQATEQFLRMYVPYVRVVGRHRADAVLHARASVRRTELLCVEARRVALMAVHATATAQVALDEAIVEERRFADERAALQRSDAYQTIGQLEDLRRHVVDAQEAVGRAEHAEARAVSRLDELLSRAATAERERDTASSSSNSMFERLRAGAGVVAAPRLSEIDGLADQADPRPAALGVARERRTDLDTVRGLLEGFERAAAAAGRAEHELADAATRLDEALTAEEAAMTSASETRHELADAVSTWAGRWTWVTTEDVAGLRAAVVDGDRPNLREELLSRSAERRQDVAAAIARLDDEATRLAAERVRLIDERADVDAERDDAPPPPPVTRRNRCDTPGAPLWRVVDFADAVSAPERAGLEAALHAAGLLDAWITPTRIDTTDELDTFLRVDPTGRPESADRAGSTLAALLVVDLPAQCPLEPDHVHAVLAGIGLETLGVSVDTAGRFALGPLVGRSAADTAEYIGATARAARRTRRLAALDIAIAETEGHLDDLATRRLDHAAALVAYDRAIDDLPSTRPVEDARRRADEAIVTVTTRRHDHVRRERDALDMTARRTATHDALRDEAIQRAIPDDRAGLDRFADSLRAFEVSIEDYARARSHERTTRTRALEFVADADRQRVEVDEHRHQLADRRATHRRLDAELATLEDTRGVEAAELVANLARVDHDLSAAAGTVEATRQEVQDAAVRVAQTEAAVAAAERERDAAHAEQATAFERVRVLRRPELRATLGLDDADDPDHFVDDLSEACAGVATGDDRRQAAKTAARNAFQRLETHLGPRYHASLDDADDVDLAMVADDDGVASVASFSARITHRRDDQRTLLTAQERQVLEDTLIDTLCRQLHHRLRDGEDQVRQMNRSLAGRTTTTGKTVQLTWASNENLSDDQRQIAKLLDRDPAYIGDDRALLRESLAHEIRAERANDPGGNYQQVLARVLDYRTWRSFGVRLRERDGSERQLSKRLFNQHSGGERATILHLPLFAAAAAHFEAAGTQCPRLIALDEAFAGIDAATTRQLLALTVDFDLDLFLTGHDFWGTYPEVPALAVAQLSHDRESHTVSSLAMRWDGAVLHHEP